jgi:hypothetical protein
MTTPDRQATCAWCGATVVTSRADVDYCRVEHMIAHLRAKGMPCARDRCTALSLHPSWCACGRHGYCSQRCQRTSPACQRRALEQPLALRSSSDLDLDLEQSLFDVFEKA